MTAKKPKAGTTVPALVPEAGTPARADMAARLVMGRERLKLTQKELGGLIGIPVSTLKKYEGSHREPGAEALARYGRAGLNVHWLATGEGEMLMTSRSDAAIHHAVSEADHPEQLFESMRNLRDATDTLVALCAELGVDPPRRLAALLQEQLFLKHITAEGARRVIEYVCGPEGQ